MKKSDINNYFFTCSDPESVFAGISMSEDVQKELISIIKRRMTPHPVKIRARKLFEREKA